MRLSVSERETVTQKDRERERRKERESESPRDRDTEKERQANTAQNASQHTGAARARKTERHNEYRMIQNTRAIARARKPKNTATEAPTAGTLRLGEETMAPAHARAHATPAVRPRAPEDASRAARMRDWRSCRSRARRCRAVISESRCVRACVSE